MMRAAGAIGMGCLLLLAACKPIRRVLPFRGDLPPRGAEKMMEHLSAARITDVRYYSAKSSAEVSDSSGTRSFKAHIRCVMDSAAWVSIVPVLGIELARVLLTPDSLKVMDKFHDTYWTGDTAMAKKRFGLAPDLSLLQQALLGQPIAFDPTDRYRSDREDGQYTLTSREKRRFRRAAEDLAEGDTIPRGHDISERRLERTLRRAEKKDAFVVKYWLEPDSFLVTRVLISDLAHDQQADVRYSARTPVNSHSLPTRVAISLSDPTRHAEAVLELDRISLDGPLQLNFRIPEKFKPME
ncbi:MAG: DUF4292 domain-containing protein [Bacteroidetes bacterium]|nr:DUF4292 domain-containing protein [Bacteroidota bacterium]